METVGDFSNKYVYDISSFLGRGWPIGQRRGVSILKFWELAGVLRKFPRGLFVQYQHYVCFALISPPIINLCSRL